MPFSDAFNNFHFFVNKNNGLGFNVERTFDSKFDDVYDIIDRERGDITRIWYDSAGWYGTGLGIEYLTTETNPSGRKIVVEKSIIAENAHRIPKRSFIHDMYVHERFLKYFKTCLRYNEPEIEVT